MSDGPFISGRVDCSDIGILRLAFISGRLDNGTYPDLTGGGVELGPCVARGAGGAPLDC